MTLKVPQEPKDLKEVQQGFHDIKDNLSQEDIRLFNPLTTVPTTSDLEIGKQTVREISGVPRYYIRGTNGTIYLLSTGVAI